MARAMTTLRAGVPELFLPVVPAMLAGIAWVVYAAWMIGRREAKRLARAGQANVCGDTESNPAVAVASLRTEQLFVFNAALTVILIALLFTGWLPAALLFMLAFVIALPINRRGWKAQQEQIVSHARSIVLGTSMIFAAGIFSGILTETGMVKAMAEVLASSIPHALTPYLSRIVAITGMPLSFVFSPDAYYYGVLPIFAQTAHAAGQNPFTIGRAAILGHTTTGFPLSPLNAATFILIGLAQVSLGEHQRFTFKWAFGTTMVMTVTAGLTGVL
jgi:CitMHS family citrate-Mg2+:H+ or citrate-Ca2+:H+ symporter